MIKSDKKKEEPISDSENKTENIEKEADKLEVVQEKLLRTMAEMENQRRRFEKEKKEAFEFGGFNFAQESLSLLDNFLSKKNITAIHKTATIILLSKAN